MGINKVQKLLIGAVGILSCYWIASIVHEHLLKGLYLNNETGANEKYPYKTILIVFPTILTWLIAALHNKLTLDTRVSIPDLNGFKCGICVFLSTLTFNYAVVMTNYPVVMAFKSCNVMSVLLVAIFCTRVRNKQLKLGKKKIIVGCMVSIGVCLFTYFDPSREDRSTETQLQGIALLSFSLLADGFLPDWQAEIKSDYKPKPREMLQCINKWVGLISLAWLCLVDRQLFSAVSFISSHPLFLQHLLTNAVLNYLGQNFVYWMVTQFKQHIVPFIISCRKIVTIAISIAWYSHPTTPPQILGMILVLATVFYEFYSETKPKPEEQSVAIKGDQQENNLSFKTFKEEEIGVQNINKL